MSLFTSAYKREIDDNHGWTNPVEIEVHRAYDGEPIRLQVGGTWGGTAHLDLPHARQVREALDEAIMLAELTSDPYTALRAACAAAGITATSPATLDAGAEQLARQERQDS